ncbi:unnamed protein product [Rhizophagus irregularis]|nr:unnamed protein product [Rhizophagus irregularis]
MRGSYVVETRAICLAFFLQKKMHKILPQNSRNLILLILDRRKDTNHYFNISLNSQSRNIRILLTLPSEIEDSHALYHIIGQVLIRMNQGGHEGGTLISTARIEDYQFLGLLQNLQNRLNDPLSYQ